MRFNLKHYRRKVVFFKILSALTLCGIVLLLSYNFFNKELAEEAKAPDKTPSGYNISISNSIFEGSDYRGKNYQLASKSLIKSGNNLYNLDTIDGKYKLGDADVDFKANKGKMNDDTKLLKLLHNIVIEYSGYLLTTDQMDVDLTKMSAQNNNEVSVKYSNSTIKADRFILDTDSNIINFEGNVLTRFKISDF